MEYAVGTLGLKAAVMPGYVRRPISAVARKTPEAARYAFWLDTYGLDSEYDYDTLWAKCLELRVAPTFHSGSVGLFTRNSISNFVYNHIGHFAAAGESVCKALFLGGVTSRFPGLTFSFLEGGAAWACSLLADLAGHWEKRNAAMAQLCNPATLDQPLIERLFREYSPAAYRGHLPSPTELRSNLLWGMPKHLIKKFAKQTGSRASFEEGARRLMARINRSVGMLCVTEKNDSILMWSHYADKHQGVCLQFRGLENLRTPALRVIYSDDYPTVELLDYEPFIDRQDATARAKQKEMIERMYLTKAMDWSYEREWRVIDWAAARSGSRGFHPLAPDVLAGVIFGCRTTDHDKQKIMDCISRSKARPKLCQANQSPVSFTLDISEAE